MRGSIASIMLTLGFMTTVAQGESAGGAPGVRHIASAAREIVACAGPLLQGCARTPSLAERPSFIDSGRRADWKIGVGQAGNYADRVGSTSESYSITKGGGRFFAIRHRKTDEPDLVEVVASGFALQRAKNQAAKGDYKLEIKGPFAGHPEAVNFIRREWDPLFGMSRR